MKIILESFGQKLLIMLLMFNIKIDGIHIKINQINYNIQLSKLKGYLHTIALAYVSSINLSDPPQLL